MDRAQPRLPVLAQTQPVPGPPARPGSRPGALVDAKGRGLVVVIGAGAVGEAMIRSIGQDVDGRFVMVVCLLALCTTVPLLVLPPAGAVQVMTAASILSLAPFGCLTVAGVFSLLTAHYRLGRHGFQQLAAGMCLPLLVFAVVAVTWGLDSAESELQVVVLNASIPLVGWIGAARRSAQQSRQHLADRDAIVGTLLEHSARGERARITRDLHDVVAHHISMIAVQAETARVTTEGLPPAGAQRLSAIGDTARAALTEMRRLLGVLREDVAEEAVQRRPQPGLQQLTELLDQAREASGAATRLIIDGSPELLDPGLELAAYRIVQEALTNVRRHAPGAAVDVEVRYSEAAVQLRIRDNGPGPTVGGGELPTSGHGLLGMQERAIAVGGRVHTGPAAGGGFLVEARLPTGEGVPT
ncbi:MAG: sensor histidine kinase [Nakamurella sp.]